MVLSNYRTTSNSRSAQRGEMSINILGSLQTLKKLRPTSKLVSKIIIRALALGVAIVAAWQGQVTISHSTQSILRQSEDTQLSTAIIALGDSESAQRIAGLKASKFSGGL